MREYELIIDEALKKGMFPTRTVPVNAEWLWDAFGFRLDREELLGYVVSDDNDLVTTSGIDFHYNWPFPQFIVGESYNILIVRNILTEEDLVYQVSDDYVTVDPIAVVDEVTYGQGGLMEVADFGEYLIMVNGVIAIHWDTTAADWAVLVPGDALPLLGTICNFKGQAVGGNVTDAWKGCDETFYVWSRIGDIDFTPGLDNEAGYRRCPYGGDVFNVRRLGDGVIGYSSKGITLLTPKTTPAASFGFSEMDDVGLCNKGAIDGSLQRHVYVGSDYILREVTSQGVKELGFYYFMQDLGTSEDIIVKYDRTKKDFYIGNSETTYLLSPYGMTRIPQHPSALWTMDEQYVYEDEISMLPSAIDLDDGALVPEGERFRPAIITTIFDMGYRGQKTVVSVETDAIVVFGPRASVAWMNTLAVMGYVSEVSLNDEGIAAITASGNEFAVQVNFTYVAELTPVKYIKVRYKMTDLRGIRGVYTPRRNTTNFRGQA